MNSVFVLEDSNATFSMALAHLKMGGVIKVPEWKGWWFLSGGEIWVRKEDGLYGLSSFSTNLAIPKRTTIQSPIASFRWCCQRQ